MTWGGCGGFVRYLIAAFGLPVLICIKAICLGLSDPK
jgi:hypothetical protein